MKLDLKKLIRSARSADRMHEPVVRRDWRVIVIFFLIINCGIIAGSLYLFWYSNSAQSIADSAGRKRAEAFREREAESLMAKYAARQEAFFALQAMKPDAADPSI